MRAGADYARSYVSKTRHGPLAKPSRRESEGGRESGRDQGQYHQYFLISSRQYM